MVRAIVVGLLGLAVAGCAAEVPPEAVAKQFYDKCDFGRQNGFHEVQQGVFDLLSKGSRETLARCAEELNAEAKEGQPTLAPHECLVLQAFDAKRGDFDTKRAASGRERVRLLVTSAGQTRTVELVREDGWKIDLNSTLELNAQ